MPVSKPAFIFDMDGVLVDTPGHNWRAIRQTLVPYGVVIDDEEVKLYLGRPLDKQFADIAEHHQLDLTFENFLQQHGETIARLEREQPLETVIGLRAFLEAARDQGIKMGVGTSSLTPRAERLLNLVGIRDFFDAIVGAEDVPEHKPNPHIFLEVARRLHKDVAKCVVFEDAANGVEAARRGGFKVIGLASAFQSPVDLADPNLVVRDFTELDVNRCAEIVNAR